MVQGLLALKQQQLSGPDPISKKPMYRQMNFPKSTLSRGQAGDPQVKGVTPKKPRQKLIAMPGKNVKLGGARSGVLVHNGKSSSYFAHTGSNGKP